MTRTASAAALAAALVGAAVLVPSSGAGAGDACVAWGRLPARVVLGPQGVTVRTTLAGTAACTGITADNGGSAVLRGPGRNNDVPMRWMRIGDSDEATYYPSLNQPGTYRLEDGALQTYDAQYRRIPASWRATSTAVKFAGRFVHVARGRTGVTATLEFYGRVGWQNHRGVPVTLQRWSGSAWRTIARGHSSSTGHVRLGVRTSSRARYRLVSATTKYVWTTTRHFGASPA